MPWCLFGGGILVFVKWIHPVENKHIFALGGYVSFVAAALIYIILQTSLTQQEKTFENTQNRLNKELDMFRKRLEEQSDRIFAQTNEKLEYTQSELQIRQKLATERNDHDLTRKTLFQTQKILQTTQVKADQETKAHQAYFDSLNTERATHAATRTQLTREKQMLSVTQQDLKNAQDNLQQAQKNHQETQQDLRQTRQAYDQLQQIFAQAKEQLASKTAESEHLQTQIKETETRLQQTKTNVETAIKQELVNQKTALALLQTAVDSIYGKLQKQAPSP